ncbi:MAG: transporter related [Chitinophagaceae bacterium]|jgi:subfamily B ATP-binding cassette protein MsbA|nr:transporter related [Chitinophagaceae bacterium]
MKTFLRLLRFSKPYYHYVPEYAVYVFLFIVLGILNYTMLIPLMDVLFNTTDANVVKELPPFNWSVAYFKEAFYYHLNRLIATDGKFKVLIYICVFVFVCTALKNLFGYLSQRVLTRMRVRLVRKIRQQLFHQFSHQSLRFFQNEKKGNLLSTLGGDVLEIESSVVSSVQTIFRDPLMIIVTFATLFIMSYQLTLFTLVFFPISGFLITSISSSLKRKAKYSQGVLGNILNLADEAITGIRIIKAFNAEKVVNQRFAEENERFSRTLKNIQNQRELASPLSEMLGVLVIMIIVVYGGSLILSGDSNLTASMFIGFVMLYFTIINPAKNIANAITLLQRGLAAGERVLRIIDTPQSIEEKPGAFSKTGFDDHIEFRNVSFRYEEKNVLNNINLKIKKGQTIALVGESGSGKSTMADLVPRFYDVPEGEILIDGINIKDLKIADLRGLMAYVSQEAILFHDSVAHNIAFAAEKADPGAVARAARVANAHGFIEQMEQGYDTTVGERGSKLSGGQRQRLTIARALYKEAPILILDEATSALDTESERLVQNAINELMKNRTSLVIAHRLSTIRHADEIVVLHQGEIVERGTHDELMARAGYYKKLVDLQEVK